MTRTTVASFNLKNLIGADQEYYKFQKYTPEEYAWKQDWCADQILSMDADIIGFQEVFDRDALQAVIDDADARGAELNDAVIPDRSKSYRKKAIFRKLGYTPYGDGALAVAPNVNDGAPGARRPGVAVLSRLGFVGTPEVIQVLPEPLDIPFRDLTGEDAGHYRITRLSRPILKVRIPMGGQVVTLFCCHLKSKLGEFDRAPDQDVAPAADLTQYDPVARALGSLRAGLRRMAEAWVMRRAIIAELEAGNPVIALGDFNDGEHSVSSEIIAGEAPFKNYAWMLRHDAEAPNDRYSKDEHTQITEAIEALRLHSAEKLFIRKSLRDMVFTSAFGGSYESIDQIYLSRHFLPDSGHSIGEMEYFSCFNDHITDGAHPEAPYNKLASDHGQIMVHLNLKG